jgi:hypothetical protein
VKKKKTEFVLGNSSLFFSLFFACFVALFLGFYFVSYMFPFPFYMTGSLKTPVLTVVVKLWLHVEGCLQIFIISLDQINPENRTGN